MKKKYLLPLLFFGILICSLLSFKNSNEQNYFANYNLQLSNFKNRQAQLLKNIEKSDLSSDIEKNKIRVQINFTRNSLKSIDFWLRYLEPVAYKKLNGPLPVEWETEVFEKFEKPYKRQGAGLTLAALYL